MENQQKNKNPDPSISEKEREKGEQTYNRLFMESPQPSAVYRVVYNPEGKIEKYQLIAGNKSFYKLIEKSEEEAKSPDKFLIGNDQLTERIDETVSKQHSVSFVIQNKKRDKYYQVSLYSPQKDHFAVIYEDITIRIKTENQLQSMNEEIASQNEEITAQNEELRTLNEKLEDALHEIKTAQSRYTELFEGSRDGIVIINEQGRFLECNQAYSNMVGYTMEELSNMDFYQITPKKWHEWEKREIVENQLLKRGYSDLYEKEYIRKDGTVFPVELRSYRHKGKTPEESFLWGVARDITSQKETEEAIRKKQKRLSDIIAHSAEMQYIHDTEHVLSYVSPQCKNILGYTEEELKINWTRLTTDHPVNKQGFDKTMKAIETGIRQKPYNLELFKKNGDKIWVEIHESPLKDEQGKVTGIVGALRNLTTEKQALEHLQELNEKLKLAMEAANEGMWEWNLKTGEVHFNERAYRMLGYLPFDKPRNKDWWFDQIHPDEKDQVLREVYSYTEGRTDSYNTEFRMKRKNGGYIWIVSHGKIIKRDGKGKPLNMVGIHRNINERKQAEQELVNKHSELRQIFETIPDGVVYADPMRRIINVNEAFEKMFGYRLEELYGKSTEMIYCSREAFLEKGRAYYNIDARGPFLPYEIKYKRKNGTEFLTETYGVPVRNQNNDLIGMLAIIRDITERKATENKIREHEQMIRLTTENINDIVWQLDDKLVFKYVSASVEKIFGYKPEEIIGTQVIKYIHPEDLEQASQSIMEKKNEANAEKTNQYRMITKSGGIKYMEVSSSIILDEEANLKGFAGVSRDITKRKEAEIELHQKILELERFNRIMTGREIKMIELKTEINELRRKLGFSKKYTSPDK